MKYTLVCFTFNKKEVKQGIEWGMILRNNWVEEEVKEEDLPILLESLGFKPPFYFPNSNKVVKMNGDFTIDNTRIIVHIIKNS